MYCELKLALEQALRILQFHAPWVKLRSPNVSVLAGSLQAN